MYDQLYLTSTLTQNGMKFHFDMLALLVFEEQAMIFFGNGKYLPIDFKKMRKIFTVPKFRILTLVNRRNFEDNRLVNLSPKQNLLTRYLDIYTERDRRIRFLSLDHTKRIEKMTHRIPYDTVTETIVGSWLYSHADISDFKSSCDMLAALISCNTKKDANIYRTLRYDHEINTLDATDA